MGGMVPDETWTKLTWTYFAVLTNFGSGTTSKLQVFSGNSAYDPDSSGVGSQPLGYDQWAAFYSKYYVAASKIRVDLWNTSANPQGQLVTLLPSRTSYTTALTVTNPIHQQPYAQTKGLVGVANGYGNRIKMKGYMTTNKMAGSRGTEIEEIWNGGTGTDPGAQWYWNLCLQSINGTNDVCQACGIIKLSYYVKFFNRVALVAS